MNAYIDKLWVSFIRIIMIITFISWADDRINVCDILIIIIRYHLLIFVLLMFRLRRKTIPSHICRYIVDPSRIIIVGGLFKTWRTSFKVLVLVWRVVQYIKSRVFLNKRLLIFRFVSILLIIIGFLRWLFCVLIYLCKLQLRLVNFWLSYIFLCTFL